jgi:hypothetical protein
VIKRVVFAYELESIADVLYRPMRLLNSLLKLAGAASKRYIRLSVLLVVVFVLQDIITVASTTA